MEQSLVSSVIHMNSPIGLTFPTNWSWCRLNSRLMYSARPFCSRRWRAPDRPGTGTIQGAERGAARRQSRCRSVGAVVGGTLGAVAGTVGGILGVQDRPRFRTYVVEQRVPSYTYESDLRVGAVLPETGATWPTRCRPNITRARIANLRQSARGDRRSAHPHCRSSRRANSNRRKHH